MKTTTNKQRQTNKETTDKQPITHQYKHNNKLLKANKQLKTHTNQWQTYTKLYV
jgi:hypothetical protein